jgi:hypothetical protein
VRGGWWYRKWASLGSVEARVRRRPRLRERERVEQVAKSPGERKRKRAEVKEEEGLDGLEEEE